MPICCSECKCKGYFPNINDLIYKYGNMGFCICGHHRNAHQSTFNWVKLRKKMTIIYIYTINYINFFINIIWFIKNVFSIISLIFKKYFFCFF